MLLSETKVTQQSHQKVLFGSVEHGCVRLQCNGGPLHADHENAITPSVDVVDALVRLPWHVAFRDQNHPARLQQSHQKPWFGPNLPTHSCGMLLSAVGSVYVTSSVHTSRTARNTDSTDSTDSTELHGFAPELHAQHAQEHAQHGLHGLHGLHGDCTDFARTARTTRTARTAPGTCPVDPLPNYWV